ncbi:hypothetical protein IWX90DRAFT_443094 [Phyllosticta citrichinensis]|uniref:Uncharacterized protein n=1 Tax=Phyllosticta citrichinensis TaxID=1130410 RepID=A0ABR1XIB8_9PEZI
MQAVRFSARQLNPLRRPLLSPSALLQPPKPRPFTHNSQLLLVMSPANPRPQLPFLHPAATEFRYRQKGGQWQLSRYLTTERKAKWKYNAWITTRTLVICVVATVFFGVAQYGIFQERLERDRPTPREWSSLTRWIYRDARGVDDPAWSVLAMGDPVVAGRRYKDCVRRLEDPEIDGQGVKEQDDIPVKLLGMGKMGLDIEAKSEPWRRGYHEVLMSLGRCAEALDTWVTDKKRLIVFPPAMVIGPNNPNPLPVPPGSPEAPREEDCRPAFAPPEDFYIKILTTKGFNARQRIEAANRMADFLVKKGRTQEADTMYQWALDIAKTAVPEGDGIIDKSGVIQEKSQYVTTNILSTAKEFAAHKARSGDVDRALPILLSILRARRQAPQGPEPDLNAAKDDGDFITTFLWFIREKPYPAPPPTGDEPLQRTSASLCDDAEVMTLIGEILYATSASSREKGLKWTRQAIADAELALNIGNLDDDQRVKCRNCMLAGRHNLEKMVQQLVRIEEERRAKHGGSAAAAGQSSWWRPWSSGNGKSSDQALAELNQELLDNRHWMVRGERDAAAEEYKVMRSKNPLSGTLLFNT